MHRLAILRVALAALLTLTAAACGQSGPLTLPESQRPIERLPPSATPAQEEQDDERENER